MPTRLVTIGLPVYRRLHFLPNVLRVVRGQDYPEIELLVSDNGQNGAQLRRLIDQHYSKPYSFRENTSTATISTHFNQIVRAASGEYFVLLADDDEITPNYVSTLVAALERCPNASVAIPRQELMDEFGASLGASALNAPMMLSGAELIRAAWGTCEFGFKSFSTTLAKTEEVVRCGGYPEFWMGHGNDDALLVKLCVGKSVALATNCSFRKRVFETSHGLASSLEDFARGIRDFLEFLDSDLVICSYARQHPRDWKECKRLLSDMAWKTFYFRWRGLYRQRLSLAQWVRGAFLLPFIPRYYAGVAATLTKSSFAPAARRIQQHLSAYGISEP
jgi:glycosyltransferase involved in cell wall biosynthesis